MNPQRSQPIAYLTELRLNQHPQLPTPRRTTTRAHPLCHPTPRRERRRVALGAARARALARALAQPARPPRSARGNSGLALRPRRNK